MKTSQVDKMQRLSNSLKNLVSARERLDKGGEIKSIQIEFKGLEPRNNEKAFIAEENILQFGDIKTQIVASLDSRIEKIKIEMRELLS